jgi:hypothetical protein
MRKQQPEMPIEVAEWQVQQMAQHRTTHEARLLGAFARVKSLDELRELDAAELLARATIVGSATPPTERWATKSSGREKARPPGAGPSL